MKFKTAIEGIDSRSDQPKENNCEPEHRQIENTVRHRMTTFLLMMNHKNDGDPIKL